MRQIAFLTAGIIAVVGLAISAWPGVEWNVAAKESIGTTRSAARKIDLNSATVRELAKLPGIGSELAERIIRNRPYSKLDELIVKKVLGRKQLAGIKERIRVNSYP